MNPKQHKFMKWLEVKGSLIHKVYPKINLYQKATIHRFENGCQGVIALEDIGPNEAIACIPLSLLITVQSIKQGPHRKIIKQYPHLFNEILSDDADFNVLTLFVYALKMKQLYSMLERIKGEKSDYYNYFAICEDSLNMFSWSKQQVEQIKVAHIVDKVQIPPKIDQIQFGKMKAGLIKNFNYFKTFFKEQEALIIPQDQDLWTLFLESYQFVMTRCYGGDGMLHSTSLVPFGDSMNHHHQNHTTYCLVNVALENSQQSTTYQNKQNHVDLTMMHQNGLIKKENVQENDSDLGDTDFKWLKTHAQNTYLVITSIEAIEKGQEIFNFFGDKSNEFLLLWYGFCYNDNIYDQFKFYVKSPLQLDSKSSQ